MLFLAQASAAIFVGFQICWSTQHLQQNCPVWSPFQSFCLFPRHSVSDPPHQLHVRPWRLPRHVHASNQKVKIENNNKYKTITTTTLQVNGRENRTTKWKQQQEVRSDNYNSEENDNNYDSISKNDRALDQKRPWQQSYARNIKVNASRKSF